MGYFVWEFGNTCIFPWRISRQDGIISPSWVTEGDGFQIGNEMGSNEFILVAKFFTKRVLNIEAIARKFTHFWRLRNGFKIKDLGDHIVLFIFL